MALLGHRTNTTSSLILLYWVTDRNIDHILMDEWIDCWIGCLINRWIDQLMGGMLLNEQPHLPEHYIY